jgi:competence protein ComEA
VEDDQPVTLTESTQPLSDIRVYVTGAVVNPGIYPVSEDARWMDAVELAGGFAPDANPEAINLARRVKDEDQILVPRVGQGTAPSVNDRPLVNLNTASEAELMSLPGIGEVRARSIVTSRDQSGPFATTDDLLTRELLSDTVYEDIVSLITVSQ